MIGTEDLKDPEFCREFAKKLLETGDQQARDYAINLLMKAMNQEDAEATFLLADLVIKGDPDVKINGERSEVAKQLMADAARLGYLPANALLNKVFDQKYHYTINEKHFENHKGPLVDFEGTVIKINREGVFVPVDAVLTYDEAEGNCLTLRLDVYFSERICEREDSEKLKDTIIRGIKLWEGDYLVFGGQHLKLKIDVTQSQNKFDNVIFYLWDDAILDDFSQRLEDLPEFKWKEKAKSYFQYRRANTVSGLHWKAHGRKMVFLMEEDDGSIDYERMLHVVKHEFGHVLGLGDLYSSLSDNLEGVSPGTYYEIDCYHIIDKEYYSVMCRQEGPVTNNDIEMIVLAFKENTGQAFQKQRGFKRISRALGKGN